MAIKLPDPGNGIPEQKTGNDEWTNMKIVRENFADQSNAASRLVGSDNGQIPLAEQTFKAAASLVPDAKYYTGDVPSNANDFEVGSKYIISASTVNAPPQNGTYGGDSYIVMTYASSNSNKIQIAVTYSSRIATSYIRRGVGSSWSAWSLMSTSPQVYSITTATAPNMVVDVNGDYSRASSSLKYKDVISKLELDSELYDKAMQVKPIIYRSKSEIDPKNWHFMSFIAEELGELEPALTQWRTHEYSEDGEPVELEKKEAEGINLNAICAVLHATNIYQDKKLKELEQRLKDLESNNEPTI